MTRLLRLTAVLVLTAPLIVATGCQQQLGERCQVDSDCANGLTCLLPAGATPQAGGTCQMTGVIPGADGGIDMAIPTTGGMDMSMQMPVDMTGQSTTD